MAASNGLDAREKWSVCLSTAGSPASDWAGEARSPRDFHPPALGREVRRAAKQRGSLLLILVICRSPKTLIHQFGRRPSAGGETHCHPAKHTFWGTGNGIVSQVRTQKMVPLVFLARPVGLSLGAYPRP